MKRLVVEIILGCCLVFLMLVNLGLNHTVKQANQIVEQWQQENARLQARIQELEAETTVQSQENLQIRLAQKSASKSLPIKPQEDSIDLFPEALKRYREEYRTNKTTMTDLQFKTWWDTRSAEMHAFEGKRVRSRGYVSEVHEKGFLTPFSITLDIDEPDEFLSASEIMLVLDPEQDRAFALSVKKGDLLDFTGTVTAFTYSLGSLLLRLEDVTFIK